ncbi:aegerolysin family protein [Serratia fonticola]|uniref:aegerolysin family protein n=1 Tax=Serratia fonticola TaxID=47917 RepID=UPI003AAA30DC
MHKNNRLKSFVTLIAILTFQVGCTERKSTITPNSLNKSNIKNGHHASPFAARSTKIILINKTDVTLTRQSYGLYHGIWTYIPPSYVEKNTERTWSSESSGIFTGTEGQAIFNTPTGSKILFEWNNPYSGSNSYIYTENQNIYNISKSGGTGNNATVTFTVTNRDIPKKYNIIIMSDPQAWRLDNNSDPNNNQYNWESFISKVRLSLEGLNSSLPPADKIRFGLLNGDITEFGRTSQRESFTKNFQSPLASSFYIYLGLGNHDYANNVNDCTDGDDLGLNACARRMVSFMGEAITYYRSELPLFNDDYNEYSNVYGSLSYSWDYGDMHYVQLQNHPTYHVDLTHWYFNTVYITESLDWLQKDLQAARSRGKTIVINFHDGTEHFINNTSAQQKEKFQSILNSNNVMAVFIGHTHNAGELSGSAKPSLYGTTRVFNSGALFKGDFLFVKVDGKCLSVLIYNGSAGTSSLKTTLPQVCAK